MEEYTNEVWECFLEKQSARGKWIDNEYGHYHYWWISNHGRVKLTNNYNERIHWPKIHLTGGHKNKRYACLSINDAPEKYIHRLVARFFILNPFDKRQVNHMDGNKLNNHISNLEWVDNSMNVRHANKLRASGLIKFAYETYNEMNLQRDAYNARHEKYNAVLELRKQRVKIRHIADQLDIPRGTVAGIVRWWKQRNEL